MSPSPRNKSSASNDYPPAPWLLRGQLSFSVWRVPAERCTVHLEPALELATLAGSAFVATCFVDYQEGSVLVYRELFGAVGVRQRDTRRRGFTVTHMWVDSERSQRGGRALWGMPKELARFKLEAQGPEGSFTGLAQDKKGKELAGARFEEISGLPSGFRIPLPLPNLQVLEGRVVSPKDTFRGSPRLLRAEWVLPEGSPLASLGLVGARPWMSAGLRDFEVNLPAATPVD